MTKQEFKERWDSNESGGGITFDDMANCAVKWGICATPRVQPIMKIRSLVLNAAGIKEEEDK